MFNYKENYNKWLEDNFFDEETREELSNITDEKEIEDRFYRDLEFGTGGLRGVMGAGTNRMNKYTIGKATKGLGRYLLDNYGVEACAKRGVVIGYDTRNNSKDFSEITANVLTGMGIKVYLHSEARPTPQLSFSVKFLNENHNGIHLIDDQYSIALQKIIENFTHYLSVNDGYGDVIYESRNNTGENSAKSPDIKLINVYHKIQANNKGIVYTDSAAVQNRNRTIVTYSKNENIAGLQFADFVAYNIIKLERCKVKEQITDFMKQIHKMAYNGGHSISEIDQRSFWGMRVLPSYLRMEELLSENKTLRNSYANLKKARNKQKRIIDAQEEKIDQLEEENKRLLDLIKSIDIKKES